MVKFSKLLEAQLIPEWKDAFVNYWLLKKNVKKIKLSRNSKLLEIQKEHEYGFSILDPIRCIVKKLSNRFDSGGKNSEILQVKNSNRGGGDDEDVYQTELVQLFSEEDEVKEFFMKLDEELNKVNQFYKTREREFVERGEILNKQLQILLDLKKILNDRRRRDIQSKLDSGTLERSNSSGRCSDCSESAGELDETSSEGPSPDEVMVAIERNRVNFIGATTRTKTKKGKPKMAMRIDKTAATLTSSISSITSMLWEDLITNPKKESLGVVGDLINEKKIQSAEKMIRGAFVELYKGLGLLKTYSSLNMLAFTKILKKFDKVANQQASDNYLKVVKRSHFISSDKVVRLTDEVESIFTKYFASNDRKKAMKFLRPQLQKDSHMVTFFTGIFTGGFVTLFGVYAILAHLSGIFSDGGYMETIYPVFSYILGLQELSCYLGSQPKKWNLKGMFALLSLHMFMYGCNLFMWKNTRINYNFIFEFSPTTALKYRDAFLICTSLMTAVVGAMVIHLLLRSTSFSSTQVDAIPGVLFLFFIGFLICPFNIFYRSTRYYFIRVIRNIISSPFCKVIMVDFFMADQLTSQIPLLRHMESTACYLLAGSFETHRYEICHSSKLYRELAYVISFAPYYWRAMQCARRWFDEGDVNHLANLGKYVSAMVAAGARLTFGMQPTLLWKFIVIATSSIATIYQLYWDFVKDWGFLNPKSKNPWLRDELILKNKSIYYVSIVINLVLRLAWVETVMHFSPGSLVEYRLLDFSLASLEIIRRGHWNFYRLENEHLNNVGKFRAIKTVPLPFRETDSDD